MKQLPIIQSLWIGDRLSTMERLCISSFQKHGHPFHLYTYGKVGDIPEGTIVKDANEIIPSDRIFKYKEHDSYAGFSNSFRYKLLLDRGGYWVDTDNVCLEPFEDDAEYLFSSQRPKEAAGSADQETNCGIIRVPKGSEVMAFCYEEATARDPNKIKWGEIGPKLLERAVKKYGLESYVAGPEVYCAIDWWEWEKFIDGSVDKSILSNAKSIHLWNEMWRRNGIDKECQFERGSLYEYFKNNYLGIAYDETRPAFAKRKDPKSLSGAEINRIRDAAVALEKQNTGLAYELMLIAHRARPDGAFIRGKLDEYRVMMGK